MVKPLLKIKGNQKMMYDCGIASNKIHAKRTNLNTYLEKEKKGKK